MDQTVKQLAFYVKKIAVYHRIFLRNLPEFINPVFDDLVEASYQTASKSILTDEEVQELIVFSEEYISTREQFLELNPNLESQMNLSEILSLIINLNSVLSTIKGE
jgi:hypothetical protein